MPVTFLRVFAPPCHRQKTGRFSAISEEVKAFLAKLRLSINAQELSDTHDEPKCNAHLKDIVDTLFKDCKGSPQAE